MTISMRRCDGGEQVQELTSDDPELLAWLRERECEPGGPPDG